MPRRQIATAPTPQVSQRLTEALFSALNQTALFRKVTRFFHHYLLSSLSSQPLASYLRLRAPQKPKPSTSQPHWPPCCAMLQPVQLCFSCELPSRVSLRSRGLQGVTILGPAQAHILSTIRAKQLRWFTRSFTHLLSIQYCKKPNTT